LNRAWHDALEVLGTALTIGRERRLLVHEGGVLALMAAGISGSVTPYPAEFIYEEALYPQAEYAFKHPLTQEVAYHIAQHLEQAGDALDAARWHARAAQFTTRRPPLPPAWLGRPRYPGPPPRQVG
jgi:hypothetical protein